MACVMIERVSQPPRRLFVANKPLHLVDFYLKHWALLGRLPRRQCR
jgi:hypothetical protein